MEWRKELKEEKRRKDGGKEGSMESRKEGKWEEKQEGREINRKEGRNWNKGTEGKDKGSTIHELRKEQTNNRKEGK